MVSNLDRIHAEITRESGRVAAEHDMASDILIKLVMEIVELEDQHRAKKTNVVKQVEMSIKNVANYLLSTTEV